MIWNILNGIGACIWVLVFVLRLTNWTEEDWANHEFDSGETKSDNRIMLGLTVITAVMHIYFALFVFSYQTSAYYRLRSYNLNVRNQVRAQGHEEANEARRMQPLPGQGTNYGGGMPGQPMGYGGGMPGQPMGYGGGIPMQGGPQPGMPMSYNAPVQGNMIYQPPSQPQQYVAPVQGYPEHGQPEQYNPVGIQTIDGMQDITNIGKENQAKTHFVG